jgi:hypothetical protein
MECYGRYGRIWLGYGFPDAANHQASEHQRQTTAKAQLLALSLLPQALAEDKECTGRHGGKYHDLSPLKGCAPLP